MSTNIGVGSLETKNKKSAWTYIRKCMDSYIVYKFVQQLLGFLPVGYTKTTLYVSYIYRKVGWDDGGKISKIIN